MAQPALMANPAAFIVVWLLIRGIRSAAGGGNTSTPMSIPQLVLAVYIVTVAFVLLVALFMNPTVGWLLIPVAVAPYWLVPAVTRALQRKGKVRLAYYWGRLVDVGWGKDGLAGGLLCATIALQSAETDEARLFLANRFDKKHGFTSPQRLLAWALFDSDRGDRERWRALFTLMLLFPLSASSPRVRTMALEWLALDALERGDVEAAAGYARGKRSSFFLGNSRKFAFKIKLEDLMGAPSRNTWAPIPGVPDYRMGTSPLLRAIYDALRVEPKPFWDLRRRAAPEAVLTKARPRSPGAGAEIVEEVEGSVSADLYSALKRHIDDRTFLSDENVLEAEIVLRDWGESINASDDDVEWAFGQIEEMMYQADDAFDDDSAIDPERVAGRITAIASDLEHGDAVRELGTWEIFNRLVEIETRMQSLEVHEPDYVVDVWETVNSAVVSCGADMWNERNEQPLGHLFIGWAGTRAFEMRDSYALEHTLSNFQVMA